MNDLRVRLKRYPAVRTAVGTADDYAADSRPIQVSLRGDDLARVYSYGASLLSLVRKTPGAVDVDTSEEDPRPEFRVRLNRKAAGDLGLDLGTVATTVRGLVAGEVVSQFEDTDGDSYDVRLRVDAAGRTRATDLLGLDLAGQGGRTLVPLSQVAALDSSTAPS